MGVLPNSQYGDIALVQGSFTTNKDLTLLASTTNAGVQGVYPNGSNPRDFSLKLDSQVASGWKQKTKQNKLENVS